MVGQTVERTATVRMAAGPRRQWWAGALATLPFWPGTALFGIVYAVTARAAGLTPVQIVGMSLLVHAGAAQFAAVNLIAGGAGALSVLFGTAITNARSLLIGASVAPHVAARPRWWRLLYAFHLTDESYAVATARFLRGDATPRYALGANLAMIVPWVGSGIVGVIVGAAIPSPSQWGIDLIIPLTFLGLLIPLLKDRRAVAVALTSGALALIGAALLPGAWYLLIAGVGGSTIGATWQRWEERRACRLTILGMALVSYALRVTMLMAAGKQFPAWLARGLLYVPIALVAALTAPGLLRPHGHIALGPEAVAGAVAALVAWRTAGRMPLVLAAGVGTFLLIRLV